MKRVLPLALLLVLMAPRAGHAQNVQDFSISSFTADYYLNRNQQQTATLKTVEQITAQFPNFDQNHGILRAIPEIYQGHTDSLKIESVTNAQGTPWHYTTSSQNGNLVLKIGDADKYVHGTQTYKITYDNANVINFQPDQDEFYWDVNGDQWQQPFATVTAVVHISRDLQASLLDKKVCYAGYSGSKNSGNCQIDAAFDKDGGKVVTASVQNLSPGETLTFDIAFNKGTFKLGPEIAQEKRNHALKLAAYIAGGAALPLITFGYLYSKWRRFGRDPKGRGVIIPEYQPPKGLNVLSSDYVLKEKLDTKAISALVVELAIKKYIQIIEVQNKKRFQKDTVSYKLRLLQSSDGLSEVEKKVVDMFFRGANQVGAETDLDELKNLLYSGVSALKKMLGKSLSAAGYFRNDPSKAGAFYYSLGGILALGGFFLVAFIMPLIGLGLGISGLIFLFFGRYMPSRSDTGVLVRDHMLGLREYIKLAEADRLKFLQSPQGAEKIQEAGLKPDDPQFKVKLFESLLPYAMVFSLEKDWAKQFESVYKQPPEWYSGNWTAFNAGYLASSLGSFSSASAVTFTSPGSSGGSGFGGGGFSGGGGGGGGGGGW